jgi:hypothetical protein
MWRRGSTTADAVYTRQILHLLHRLRITLLSLELLLETASLSWVIKKNKAPPSHEVVAALHDEQTYNPPAHCSLSLVAPCPLLIVPRLGLFCY